MIGLAAGGTGGHMFPAEALAQEMKRRGWRTLLFTDDRGMRFGDSFPADVIARLSAANPNASGLGAKVSAGFALTGGLITAMRAIRKHKPSVVVGFGGYPSAPGMMAARLMGVPYGVHEQNAVLGRVNRFVAPNATFVAHAFQQLDRLPACKGQVVQLGNPVRDAVMTQAGATYPATDEKLHLLVFGGSQGASLFSKVVPSALIGMPEHVRARLQVTQQVREQELAEVTALYKNAGIDADLAPFFADIPERMASAHLVIARAGASSVTELAVIGRPSVLIPLGIAMDDHQTGNAQVLVKAGAARLIPEPAFVAGELQTQLEELLNSPAALAQMAIAAAHVAPDNATAKLADLVEKLAR
jgi:UDP-N-acetylglucosamine--N-acetylmuramyl-(pentapeptide) pyrophosphoryl-undecaprenol N-acetylglucosamine transferase